MGGRGSGGHNRKTAKQRELEGNPGHRPINKQEPNAPPASGQAPKSLDPAEREFWKQIFPIVSKMRVMTKADVFALGQLCRFMAEEQECTRQIAQLGRLIPKKNEAGKVIAATLNPLCRVRSDAARHIRSYLAVFGLGPSFRAALHTPVVDPKNPNDSTQDTLDDFFSGETAGEVVQ